jgi:hypothetical protein
METQSSPRLKRAVKRNSIFDDYVNLEIFDDDSFLSPEEKEEEESSSTGILFMNCVLISYRGFKCSFFVVEWQ